MGTYSEDKKGLIEEIGLSFQDREHFTPLAARLYAIMILSHDEGFTFGELMAYTEASKSSVSTNLNLLIQLKYVEYFTKPGDRKRYFRSTRNYLKLTLNEHLAKVEEELQLVGKINSYHCEHHPGKFKKSASQGLLFQHYLESQRENIKKTIGRIVDLQKAMPHE